ncbi:hypothetical protein CC80DRAFT_488700 [Byssothecium circinans]|uniref:Uncharacterized protein n=1 Tax=Byssothecium circinans TaxID=147558 RepID=A0A6A5UEV2_9PLEO|nr:hypothetical protein CC80DRAFT_488700 [Byssothecium circinans]
MDSGSDTDKSEFVFRGDFIPHTTTINNNININAATPDIPTPNSPRSAPSHSTENRWPSIALLAYLHCNKKRLFRSIAFVVAIYAILAISGFRDPPTPHSTNVHVLSAIYFRSSLLRTLGMQLQDLHKHIYEDLNSRQAALYQVPVSLLSNVSKIQEEGEYLLKDLARFNQSWISFNNDIIRHEVDDLNELRSLRHRIPSFFGYVIAVAREKSSSAPRMSAYELGFCPFSRSSTRLTPAWLRSTGRQRTSTTTSKRLFTRVNCHGGARNHLHIASSIRRARTGSERRRLSCRGLSPISKRPIDRAELTGMALSDR